MSKRYAVASLAVVALLVTSGCIGFLTGDEALSFDSEPVKVTDSSKNDASYNLVRRDDNTVNRTFTVAGQEREVSVTNHFAEYSRSSSVPLFGDQQVARFSVFTTPEVTIQGQGPFNPAANLNNRDLVLRLQEQYESLDNVQFESNRTMTVLGEETVVSKFRADATMENGQTTEVFIHITKVRHDGDYVIAAGVYPTKVDGEQERIDTLLQGINHPAEAADASE